MKTAKPKVQLLDYCEMETYQNFYQLYWIVFIIFSLTLIHLIQYFNYYTPHMLMNDDHLFMQPSLILLLKKI